MSPSEGETREEGSSLHRAENSFLKNEEKETLFHLGL